MTTVRLVKEFSAQDVAKYLELTLNGKLPASFFLSEHWINAWLTSISERPTLLLFESNGGCIGLAFLFVQSMNRGPVNWQRGYLNQTGYPQLDQVWIEQNDIIALPQYRGDCITALINSLILLDLDELHISMAINASDWINAADTAEFYLDSESSRASTTTLQLSQNSKRYSRNTRSKISKSMREIASHWGEIQLDFAVDTKTKHAYFNALGELHKVRWQTSKEGSGFTNPHFLQHHRNLISDSSACVSLCKISAGETILGYTYNFIWNNTILFYCSGINHTISSDKIKPGYVIHAMLIEHFAAQGYEVYDFLGGDSQYKRSLSDASYEMQCITITTNNVKGKLLTYLKSMKAKYITR